VQEKYAGQKMKCRKCGGLVPVPRISAAADGGSAALFGTGNLDLGATSAPSASEIGLEGAREATWCFSCLESLPPGTAVCPKCGAPIASSAPEPLVPLAKRVEPELPKALRQDEDEALGNKPLAYQVSISHFLDAVLRPESSQSPYVGVLLFHERLVLPSASGKMICQWSCFFGFQEGRWAFQKALLSTHGNIELKSSQFASDGEFDRTVGFVGARARHRVIEPTTRGAVAALLRKPPRD